jgi:hypothetical protein
MCDQENLPISKLMTEDVEDGKTVGRTEHFGGGVGNLAAAERLREAFEISWDANTDLQIAKNPDTTNGQPGEVAS